MARPNRLRPTLGASRIFRPYPSPHDRDLSQRPHAPPGVGRAPPCASRCGFLPARSRVALAAPRTLHAQATTNVRELPGLEHPAVSAPRLRQYLLRGDPRTRRGPHHLATGAHPDRWRAGGIGPADRGEHPIARLQARGHSRDRELPRALRSRRRESPSCSGCRVPRCMRARTRSRCSSAGRWGATIRSITRRIPSPRSRSCAPFRPTTRCGSAISPSAPSPPRGTRRAGRAGRGSRARTVDA